MTKQITKQQILNVINDCLIWWSERLDSKENYPDCQNSCSLCVLANNICTSCPVTDVLGLYCWINKRDPNHAIMTLLFMREIISERKS